MARILPLSFPKIRSARIGGVAQPERESRRRYQLDRPFERAIFIQSVADPANRLVAGELEARWNKALTRVAEIESKL